MTQLAHYALKTIYDCTIHCKSLQSSNNED